MGHGPLLQGFLGTCAFNFLTSVLGYEKLLLLI